MISFTWNIHSRQTHKDRKQISPKTRKRKKKRKVTAKKGFDGVNKKVLELDMSNGCTIL